MVLTSICFLTWSAGVSRTGAMMSRRPALDRRTSRCVMLCLVLSSSAAAAGSVSTVESIFMIMILLPLPTGTSLRDSVAEAVFRTAAMTVVSGRRTKAERRHLPIPRLAPVIRYVSPDMLIDVWVIG